MQPRSLAREEGLRKPGPARCVEGGWTVKAEPIWPRCVRGRGLAWWGCVREEAGRVERVGVRS